VAACRVGNPYSTNEQVFAGERREREGGSEPEFAPAFLNRDDD
jgi:hypothetical protein